MTNQLFIYRNESISLREALKAGAGMLAQKTANTCCVSDTREALNAGTGMLAEAMGLLYSADKCRVLTLNAMQTDAAPKSAMERPPFEARVFNQTGELRWVADAPSFDLNNWDNQGVAVVLTEENEASPPAKWNPGDKTFVDSRSDQYILWGEYEDEKDENRRFFEHRMGNLFIPKTAFVWENPEVKKRAALKVKEYIAACDDHGNCTVIAERLLGFDVFPEPPKKRQENGHE